MRTRLAALACLAIAGCPGRPVDPLAEERARLQQLEREPLVDGWPAQALLVVPASTLAGTLEQAFANALAQQQEALRVEAGPGLVLDVVPALRVQQVRVEPGADCARCARVRVDLDGTVGVRGAVLGLQLQHALGVRATLAGVVETWLASADGVHRVQSRPVASASWAVSLELDALPGSWSQGLSEALEQQLERSLAARTWPAVDVVHLDAAGPVRLRGLRVDPAGDGGLAIALAFVALDPGRVEQVPGVEHGLLLHVPQATLLALARAAALRQPPVDGHAVEPLRLELEGDRFALWLRIWEVAARPSARDFHVRGRVLVDDAEKLRLEPESVRELGPAGQRYDPLHLLTRAAILSRLGDSLRAALPARVERSSLGQVAELRVLEARGVEGALQVQAALELKPSTP